MNIEQMNRCLESVKSSQAISKDVCEAASLASSLLLSFRQVANLPYSFNAADLYTQMQMVGNKIASKSAFDAVREYNMRRAPTAKFTVEKISDNDIVFTFEWIKDKWYLAFRGDKLTQEHVNEVHDLLSGITWQTKVGDSDLPDKVLVVLVALGHNVKMEMI